RKASAVAAPAGAMHIELRIGIDIRGKQPVDNVHAGNTRTRPANSCGSPTSTSGAAASAASRSTTPAAGGFLSIDGDVEGSASPPIRDMWIRSAIQQQSGNIVMIVIEGDHQRSDAFRRRHIDISAGPDQRLDAVIAAVAPGIQQRGKSSDGTILSAGLRGNLVRPVAI